eukprot:comp35022_c0_seq1/m.47308 comp35022_c0_seq1/g.47308  ORF comp35022_c0_seq1/g.47308 comp35022_c0_seq1/m.47308 type:complete len:181 (-) comp35022_c0_seq1:493-1035(-)
MHLRTCFVAVLLSFSPVALARPKKEVSTEKLARWDKTARLTVYEDENCTQIVNGEDGNPYKIEFQAQDDACLKLPNTSVYVNPFIKRYGGPTLHLAQDDQCEYDAVEKHEESYMPVPYGTCVGPILDTKLFAVYTHKDCVSYHSYIAGDDVLSYCDSGVGDYATEADDKTECDPNTWTCH